MLGPPLAEETIRPASPPALEPAPDSAETALARSIDALIRGHHSDPFALLGPHPVSGGWTIRFFLPWAAEAGISLSSAGAERPRTDRPPAASGSRLVAALSVGDGRDAAASKDLVPSLRQRWDLMKIRCASP